MHELSALSYRRQLPLLIAFADIHGYARHAQRISDEELADELDAHYEQVARLVGPANGVVVKYIGDCALLAFEEAQVDAGVECLLELKETADAWLRQRRWSGCTLNVKAHFGQVIAGPYGPPGARRFDLIGKAVNTAARLPSPGLAISSQVFRKLARPTRVRFKKHTPPITYIRQEDAHRD